MWPVGLEVLARVEKESSPAKSYWPDRKGGNGDGGYHRAVDLERGRLFINLCVEEDDSVPGEARAGG